MTSAENKAVFLSYASQDSRLCRAVWGLGFRVLSWGTGSRIRV